MVFDDRWWNVRLVVLVIVTGPLGLSGWVVVVVDVVVLNVGSVN